MARPTQAPTSSAGTRSPTPRARPTLPDDHSGDLHAIGAALETDACQTIAKALAAHLGIATEVDESTGVHLSTDLVVAVGVAEETDEAVTLTVEFIIGTISGIRGARRRTGAAYVTITVPVDDPPDAILMQPLRIESEAHPPPTLVDGFPT